MILDYTAVLSGRERPAENVMKAEQQSLFELDPAPWEEDDAREQLVATVVFSTGPARPFDYFGIILEHASNAARSTSEAQAFCPESAKKYSPVTGPAPRSS